MGTPVRPRAGLIVLRRAIERDAGAMQQIEQASFSDPWSRASLASCIDSPMLAVTIAERGGAGVPEVTGYAIAGRAADEVELLNLAVAPAARGQGIGRRLVETVLADATQWGAAAVFLEVRASNEAARRLYESIGFAEVGRRKGYYRRPSEDALILRKTLS
jgi:[ribosomal protein S18]-alanine N-acetyltransferase